MSKIIRGTTKQAAKHAKDRIPSTGNKYAVAALETGLDVAENQASADPSTSMKDRLKMAGGDVIGGVADTVDNPIVSEAVDVAKVSQFLQCTKLAFAHALVFSSASTFLLCKNFNL